MVAEQDAALAGREMNAPPKHSSGDGAPPGGTKTPRREPADGGPLKHAVARSAARRRQRRRHGAPRGAPHACESMRDLH